MSALGQDVAAGSRPAGLTSAEAAARLTSTGPNKLPEPRRPRLTSRVLAQLRDPMILLLLAAAGLAIGLREWPNAVIIGLVVVFNTTVGVVQQVRADRAMTALRQLVAPHAVVLRDGHRSEVLAEEVVPGDVVLVAAGDVVPADATLLAAHQLQVNQAHLTGESLPVGLDVGEEVAAGSLVTRGRAEVEVTLTGAASAIGRIAGLLARTTVRATPLQRRLGQLSRVLVVGVLALTVVVMVDGLARGRPLDQMVLVGLSLAVAAVPESLPAVVTVALALGARRMARRNAVVRDLMAVETLGSVTVVATDKTGTLTEGTMLAERLWTPQAVYRVSGTGYAPAGAIRPATGEPRPDPGLDRLLRAARLCNDAKLAADEDGTWRTIGDPLEGALLALAAKGGDADAVAQRWPRVSEDPFDHATLRMVTRHQADDGSWLTVCKGAPEAVLASLPDDATTRRAARAATELAGQGYRVLALADRQDAAAVPVEELELVGLVAIGDPPRHHVPAVVDALHRAGIQLVLLTGDHRGTALAIARRIGLATSQDDGLDAEQLTDGAVAADLRVVSRVQPHQKVAVVESLQRQGEFVAMLGDGVNDAPALRRADIGVAAGRGGSEVAKQAADVVLLDDDLSTVVAAVEEGRRIMANIRAFLTFALSGGLAEVGVMLLGPLTGLVLPLLPGQILWINLLTHGITGMAFGSEPVDLEEMDQPPRSPQEAIVTRRAGLQVAVATVALTIASLVAASVVGGSGAERRTLVFVGLGLGQLAVALALRARQRRAWRQRGLELAVAVAAAMLLVPVLVPAARGLLGTTSLGTSALLVAAGGALACGLLVAGLRRVLPHPRP